MSHEPPNPFGPDWSALEATQAFIREGALREHMKRKVELEREVARLTKERDEAREALDRTRTNHRTCIAREDSLQRALDAERAAHAETRAALADQAAQTKAAQDELASAQQSLRQTRAALEEWKAEAAERDEAYRLAWKDKCEAEKALVEARAALDAERAAHAETKRERTALCVTLEATEIVLQAAGFSIDDGLIEAVSAALAALATARREALEEAAMVVEPEADYAYHYEARDVLNKAAAAIRALAAREGEKK